MRRPKTFDEFNGQKDVVDYLKVVVRSAKARCQPLDHILLVGPAGTGKTSLSVGVIPTELGAAVRSLNCASIEKATDLTSVISTMPEGSILFLDEMHALPAMAKEHLLTVMEDGKLYVKLGEDKTTDVIEVQLPKFTIIGATTRQGVLDGPMRSRFTHMLRLDYYSDDEMSKVIQWLVDESEEKVKIDPDAVGILVPACHGIARKAVNTLRACIDTVYGDGVQEAGVIPRITSSIASTTLKRLGYVGEFDQNEVRYLKALRTCGGRAGLATLSAMLDETESTITEVYEPWLLRRGHVLKERTGRALNDSVRDLISRL